MCGPIACTASAQDPIEFVMGTEVYSPPALPMPAKGVRFEDPNFHTTVLRFTDQAIDAYQGPGIQNEYAKADPENADGGLVILRGNTAYWYLYDRAENAILGRRDGGFPDRINWVGMSMSGNHCMVGYDDLLYPDAFTPDLTSSFSLPDGSNGHGDLAQTVDGRDVHVYQNVSTDYIAMTDLDSGEETPLVKIPFTTNYDIGLHVSGNCAATPGWVLISTYGAYDPPPERTHSWMDTQLFLVELKADPRIYRITDRT